MGRGDRAAGGQDGDGGMGTVNLPGAAHSPAFRLCSDADPFPETGEVTILLSTRDRSKLFFPSLYSSMLCSLSPSPSLPLSFSLSDLETHRNLVSSNVLYFCDGPSHLFQKIIILFPLGSYKICSSVILVGPVVERYR